MYERILFMFTNEQEINSYLFLDYLHVYNVKPDSYQNICNLVLLVGSIVDDTSGFMNEGSSILAIDFSTDILKRLHTFHFVMSLDIIPLSEVRAFQKKN